MLWGDCREAIEHADRALALAAELGLPEPALASGLPGRCPPLPWRCRWLADMRNARDTAIAQGLGRDVAVNLRQPGGGHVAGRGAAAAPGAGPGRGTVCPAPGGSRRSRSDSTRSPWAALVELGCPGGGPGPGRRAGPPAGKARELCDAWSRSVRPRPELGTCGASTRRPPRWANGQRNVPAKSASPEMLASAYPPAAAVRVAHGDGPGAIALLAELSDPHAARTEPYAANLADAVRTALAAGAPGLAAELAGAVQPWYPLQQHAAVTARALLAEQHGQHRRSGGPVRRRRRPLAAVRGCHGRTSPGTARPRPLPARALRASRGPAAADRSPATSSPPSPPRLPWPTPPSCWHKWPSWPDSRTRHAG